MKERKRKVLVLIPLNLDGYLFNKWTSGKGSQVRQRLAADFRGWKRSHSQFEQEVEKVIRALRSDDAAREGALFNIAGGTTHTDGKSARCRTVGKGRDKF
jgi:hypothetical protein